MIEIPRASKVLTETFLEKNISQIDVILEKFLANDKIPEFK